MASLRKNQQSSSSPHANGHNDNTSPTKSLPHQRNPRHNNNTSHGISLRRVSWLLMGATALALVCGFLVVTVWLPSHANHPTTATGTTPFRQLRHFDSARPQPTAAATSSSVQRKTEQDVLTQHQILQFLNNSDNADSQPQQQQQTPIAPSLQHLQDTWEYPLVHIVNTRFMQEQGHLKALGRARLYLFQTFCLPSILHQSTQQFLWIIKTDPHLDAVLLDELIQTLAPYPNIYLVASNVNYMIRDTHAPPGSGHSWRDGAEIRDLLAAEHIYTGNLTRLYQAMVQKDRQVVLETRLDADDGLHKFYLQQIQDKALEQFLPSLPRSSDGEEDTVQQQQEQIDDGPKTIPKWLYWCTRRHVEWHGGVQERRPPPQLPGKNYTTDATNDIAKAVDYHGSLLIIEHSKLCITPGITVGFGIGTPADQVPIHAHDKLFQAIHDLAPEEACGYRKASHCLELVEDFLLVAVRARTPTSAGMQRVEDRKHKKPQASPKKTFLFWGLLHDDFAVLREQIKFTNQFILNHLVPIAKDNLEGQCTSDHSCKVRTAQYSVVVLHVS